MDNNNSSEKGTAWNIQELQMLHKISVLLTRERDFDKLFGYILDSAIEYTRAEGATIYMVDEESQELKFIKVYNSKMQVSLSSKEIDWIPVSLYNESGRANLLNLAALCYHQRRSFNFEDVYSQDIFDSSGTRQYDERNGYRTQSIVAIPMADHKDNVIGVIQLINALDEQNEPVPFPEQAVENLEILTSISAILLNNHKLVIDLQTSFHQFIKSIAWAIDRKSKHFSGHIARVSELVNRFAYAINEYSEPCTKFGELNFSEDELEEIKIAGLMHDLGKIITPMHVLDKSRKLEGIFDRIELVNERIAHLRTLLKMLGEKPDYEYKAEVSKILPKLDNYERAIERINPGREYLSDEDKALLEEIYRFKFKYEGKEYIILNGDEYYNLSVRSGTLNREDLEIIREHAYVTGQMLSQIRFPKYLSKAPIYARQHHEKLNGKGYPNGLEASEIPLQSRIIALADVFEALTAIRPYKESKTLSKSYEILKKMINSYEIDGDLFDFAIKSGIFHDYAKQHLQKEQIDTKE